MFCMIPWPNQEIVSVFLNMFVPNIHKIPVDGQASSSEIVYFLSAALLLNMESLYSEHMNQ